MKKEWIIVMEEDGKRFKISKVRFGSDGGLMIFAPYHKSRKGYLFKMPVDYDKNAFKIYTENLSEQYIAPDKVKLSHHASGFVQFSGGSHSKIRSGVDDNGNPRGLGLWSFPLSTTRDGPVFDICCWGLHDFDELRRLHRREGKIVLQQKDILNFSNEGTGLYNKYLIQIFYFLGSSRKNIKTDSKGRFTITKYHPSGAIYPAYIMDPTMDYEDGKDGFLGVACLKIRNTKLEHQSGYILGSASSQLDDKKFGEVLNCVYPIPDGFMYPGLESLEYIEGTDR